MRRLPRDVCNQSLAKEAENDNCSPAMKNSSNGVFVGRSYRTRRWHFVSGAASGLLVSTLLYCAPIGDGRMELKSGLKMWSVEQMPGGTVTAKDDGFDIDDKDGCTVWF